MRNGARRPSSLIVLALLFVKGLEGLGPPACSFYALDLSFNTDTGLVTAKNSTSLLLGCDQPYVGINTSNAKACMSLTGPEQAAILNFAIPANRSDFRQIDIGWEDTYLGTVSVQLLCNVSNLHGQSTDAASLNFAVVPDLFVQPTATVIA